MKKILNYFIVFITFIFIGVNNVYANEMCNDTNILKALSVINYLIKVVKIVVPLLIIIVSSIGFGKLLISGDKKDVQDQLMKFIKRFVAALLIFFLPNIIGLLLNLVDENSEYINKFQKCNNCILNGDCGISGSTVGQGFGGHGSGGGGGEN